MVRLLSTVFVNCLFIACLAPHAIAAPQGSVDLAATGIPADGPKAGEDSAANLAPSKNAKADQDLAPVPNEVTVPGPGIEVVTAPKDAQAPQDDDEDDEDGKDDQEDDEDDIPAARLTSAGTSETNDAVKPTATVVAVNVDGNDTSASDVSIEIPLLPVDAAKAKSTDAKQLVDDELKLALPSILNQLDVPDNEINSTVAEGKPLIEEALAAMFSGQDLEGEEGEVDETTGLTRRGIFGKVGKWIKKTAKKIGKKVGKTIKDKVIKPIKRATCDVFASATLPGYLTFAKLFRLQNRNGQVISREHKFFLYPVHRDLLRNHKIRVHWRADFPVGFGRPAGATFGRQVYLRDGELTAKDGNITAAFRDQSRLLVHELVHCGQYKRYSWNLAKFGMKYLKEYCLAGFKYRKNKLEAEAYRIQHNVDELLNNDRGNQFFAIWRKHGLFRHLRYPTQPKYTRGAFVRGIGRTWQLVFEKGVLQISSRGCYRYGSTASVTGKKFTCPK